MFRKLTKNIFKNLIEKKNQMFFKNYLIKIFF